MCIAATVPNFWASLYRQFGFFSDALEDFWNDRLGLSPANGDKLISLREILHIDMAYGRRECKIGRIEFKRIEAQVAK